MPTEKIEARDEFEKQVLASDESEWDGLVRDAVNAYRQRDAITAAGVAAERARREAFLARVREARGGG